MFVRPQRDRFYPPHVKLWQRRFLRRLRALEQLSGVGLPAVFMATPQKLS
jgi:hypothetical protein